MSTLASEEQLRLRPPTLPSEHAGAGFARLLAAREPLPMLMGVLNLTPDSFSDGGRFEADDPVAASLQMVSQGAVLIDVGGESTRPGAAPVPAEEELRRVLPVIEALTQAVARPAIVSIDTYKASTAEAALSAGAGVVNDVRGLQGDPDMAEVVSSHGAGVVVMHNPGLAGSSAGIETDVVEACRVFFTRSMEIATRAGVSPDRIVLDPGIGFGKTPEQNCALISRLGELRDLGYPLLVGASRKGFLGHITGRSVGDRLAATIAAHLEAARAGAAILRVHDVAPHADALAVAAAIGSQAR